MQGTFYHIEVGTKSGRGYWAFDITDEHISEITDSLQSGNRVLFGHNYIDSKMIASIWIIATPQDSEHYRSGNPGDDATLFEFLKTGGQDVTIEFMKTLSNHHLPIPSSKLDNVRTYANVNRAIDRNVFIVHGHDLQSRSELISLLRELGLNPIVLGEQANEGRTLIEKLEYHASNVGYVFVLLTPDDRGGKEGRNLHPRARQNVILELGFFIGKLGRGRVCVLYKQGVEIPSEIPSDIQGLAYWPYNDSLNEQRDKIKKELETADIIF